MSAERASTKPSAPSPNRNSSAAISSDPLTEFQAQFFPLAALQKYVGNHALQRLAEHRQLANRGTGLPPLPGVPPAKRESRQQPSDKNQENSRYHIVRVHQRSGIRVARSDTLDDKYNKYARKKKKEGKPAKAFSEWLRERIGMNRYGGGSTREHHLIPQEFAKVDKHPQIARRLQKVNIDVHDWMIHVPYGLHTHIHGEGWNDEWKAWFKENPNFTPTQVRDKVNSMLKDPKYKIPRKYRVRMPNYNAPERGRDYYKGKGGGLGGIKRAGLRVGAGLGVSFFSSAFRDDMKRTMAEMPMPKIDKRHAREYFTDPKTLDGVQFLDILHKETSTFGHELQEDHVMKTAGINVLLLLLYNRPLDDDPTLSEWRAFQERAFGVWNFIGDYEDKLTIVSKNIEGALELEPLAQRKIEAAEDLFRMVDNPAGLYFLFYVADVPFEDIMELRDILLWLPRLYKQTFANLRQLEQIVEKLQTEVEDLDDEVRAFYNGEFLHFHHHLSKKK